MPLINQNQEVLIFWGGQGVEINNCVLNNCVLLNNSFVINNRDNCVLNNCVLIVCY